MPRRLVFPRLNELFDAKHIRDDLGHDGICDPEVHTLAVQLKRLRVTYNAKDFREFATRSQESGVIAVSANMPFHQVDTKPTALFIRSSKKSTPGKIYPSRR
jgi:Domain of unknown function (DUF5615)